MTLAKTLAEKEDARTAMPDQKIKKKKVTNELHDIIGSQNGGDTERAGRERYNCTP